MPIYIGLDLGGTNIKAGVMDESAVVLAKLSVPTRAEKGPDAVIHNMAEAARQVAAQANIALDDVDMIGIGTPGPVDYETGSVLAAPNMPGWTNIRVRDKIIDELGRPAVLENDANAAAFGEYWAGAGRDKSIRHLIMLTLGTGIGSGFIVDGRIVRGANGYGGEIGHIVVNPKGPTHTSGSPGCFEHYASATGTGRRAVELIEGGGDSCLKPTLDKHGEISAEQVFDAAKQGDQLALHVVKEVTDTLGLVCVNLCRLFDPQMILFAGGMILSGDFLFDRIRAGFMKYDWKILEPRVKIVPAELGNDAGIVGAAAVAWDAHQNGE